MHLSSKNVSEHPQNTTKLTFTGAADSQRGQPELLTPEVKLLAGAGFELHPSHPSACTSYSFTKLLENVYLR